MGVGSRVRLSLRGVSKTYTRYDGSHGVFNKFDMDVFDGEFLSVFGPNGCGKSTLLHLIAGIIEPDEGTLAVAFGDFNTSAGIVFQNYEKSLMPWLTCLDNIALPLEARSKLSKQERREKARSITEELGLNLPFNHYPYEMSGGQKQLTCIARALIQQPSMLLLDEPFASLDYQTRLDMQSKLQNIWIKTKITTIFISHEIDEAIYLADRLLLLTARPARVAGWFDISLPRPRSLDSLSSQKFTELKSQILESFAKEVLK